MQPQDTCRVQYSTVAVVELSEMKEEAQLLDLVTAK